MAESHKPEGVSRREFLRRSLAGAAGAAVAFSPLPAPVANPKKAVAAEEVVFRVAERSIRFKVDHWRALGEKLVAAHPEMNLKVQVEELDFGPNYDQAVLTNLSGGTPHDLFWVVDVENYHFFAAKGVIQPLDPYIKRDNYDIKPFLPAVINFFTWPNEGLHLLPTGIHNGPLNLFFNKDMFDAAGVAYPTLDTTTDQIIDMAKKLTKVDKNIFGLVLAVDWLEQQIVLARSYGGDILSEDGKESWVLKPETIAAYKWMYDAIHTHKVTPKPKTFEDNSKAFVSGSSAIHWDGPWRMAEYPAVIKDFKYDMTLSPKGPAGRHGQLVQEGYPMPKDAKHKDLAWEFVKLMSSAEDGIFRPSLGFISAARTDSILAPELMKDPHYALYAKDMVDHTARTPTLPANYRIKELFNNISDFTSPMWTGETSVEDGLTQLDATVKEILSKKPL